MRETSYGNTKQIGGSVEGVNQLNAVGANVTMQHTRAPQGGKIAQRTHGQSQDRYAGLLQIAAADSFGAEAGNVRGKLGAIERTGGFDGLALAASQTKFANHQENWPGLRHPSRFRCLDYSIRGTLVRARGIHTERAMMADHPTQSARSGSGRFVTNVIWNWTGMLSSLGAAFLLTPYMLHKLGDQRYGMWSLAYSLIDYCWLL